MEPDIYGVLLAIKLAAPWAGAGSGPLTIQFRARIFAYILCQSRLCIWSFSACKYAQPLLLLTSSNLLQWLATLITQSPFWPTLPSHIDKNFTLSQVKLEKLLWQMGCMLQLQKLLGGELYSVLSDATFGPLFLRLGSWLLTWLVAETSPERRRKFNKKSWTLKVGKDDVGEV